MYIIELFLDQEKLKYLGNFLVEYLRDQLPIKKGHFAFDFVAPLFQLPSTRWL